jgi:diguanylate cyclase (GGDEF)-like protein/PAS domain S-box-containing protein
MNKQRSRTLFLWAVTLSGAAVTILCASRLPFTRLDLRFLVLALITIFISSKITIRVPRTRGRISISDTFVFLTLLLFGGEAAVLLAAAEAFVSSTYFSKRLLVRSFNAAVMALSTLASAMLLRVIFGDSSLLSVENSANLVVALCVMALVQFAFNSGLVTISIALQNRESVWRIWQTNFLWASLTYFAGAFGAGIVGRLIDEVGTFGFLATTPILVLVYLTYRTYLNNIETSANQAEQARRHVEELNRHLAEQERISKALEESQAHFRTAFDHAVIGMALVGPDGRWLRVNRSLCSILGYTEEEFLATDFQRITHREDLGRDLAEAYRIITGEIQSFQLEKRYIHKLGHEVWATASSSLVRDADGQPLHFILQIQDITERKRAEAAIQTLSLIDELTGLYNRRGFMAFAEQHLNSVHRSDKGLAIIYADLDGLKQINDCFGHPEGDRALIKTAELLKETFRSSDVLGRLGGDEFTVLAAIEPDGGVSGLISRLEQKFRDFNALKLTPYQLSISIGVAALGSELPQSIEELLALADAAMYENKRSKKKGLTAVDPLVQQLHEAVA